jgi:hypothetical protein
LSARLNPATSDRWKAAEVRLEKLCGQNVGEAVPFPIKGRECFFSGAEIQIIRPGIAGCCFPGFRIWTPAGFGHRAVDGIEECEQLGRLAPCAPCL